MFLDLVIERNPELRKLFNVEKEKPTVVKSEPVSNVVERIESDNTSNTTKSVEQEKPKKEEKVNESKLKEKPKDDAVITMQNRESYNFNNFINTLKGMNLNFTQPNRFNTGLYELNIIYPNNQYRLISADIDGLLYDKQFKFFDGHINPGDEYAKPCYLLQNLLSPNPTPISIELFELNKKLDLQTLKVKDIKEIPIAYEQATKALAKMQEEIMKVSGKEPYRFAFARYENGNDFSLVSSRKNLASNLDTNSNLKVSNEIWITVKGDDVKFTAKKY